MNAVTAPIFYSSGAQFYPDPGGDVGKLVKPVDAQTLVVFDYTSLIPADVTVKNIDTLVLDIQTNPQLIISNTSIPDMTKKKFSFVVSAGVGGVSYGLTVNTIMSDDNEYSHVLHVNVVSPTIDSCCAPGSTSIGVSAGLQAAVMDFAAGGVYGNSMPRYYVSALAPTAPLVFDRWYNNANGVISDYVTDGKSSWWQALYSLEVNLTKLTLFYFATAGQVTIDTTVPDIFSNQLPLKSTYALDVSVNGVRCMPQTPDGFSGDYDIDMSSSTITFDTPLTSKDVIILDIVEIA